MLTICVLHTMVLGPPQLIVVMATFSVSHLDIIRDLASSPLQLVFLYTLVGVREVTAP